MNIFKALICLDYYNLRIQHRTRELSSGSVHRIGIAWICNTLTLIGGYFIYFKLHNESDVVYDTLSELHYYALAGRVIMIVILSIIYLLAFTIYGDKNTIQSTLKTFVSLEPERQERIAKNANRYFTISWILFLIVASLILYLFKIQ
jgi:uncharacterized metal-binding protein